MKERKIHKIYLFLALAVLSPFSFTACDNANPEINILLDTDYREIIAAIGDANQSLSNKMALIEAAMRNGLSENESLMQLIQEALASMGGTMEEKFDAIEAVVKARTTTLETKLALVEAAVNQGFVDDQAQQELLQQAVASLGGSAAEKLAAVEAAVKDQAPRLETKLGLIEAALQEGFADDAKARALVAEAVDSMEGTLAEKMAAVEAAVGSQTADLSAKLALIETAIQEGFAADTTGKSLIRMALDSLGGHLEQQAAAIEAAIQSQTSTLETKLKLLEGVIGATDNSRMLELVRQAVAALDGTAAEKLAAVEQALQSQSTGLIEKIGLIAEAVKAGLLEEKKAIDAMKTALNTSVGTVDDDLKTTKDAILGQLETIATTLSAGAFTQVCQAIASTIGTQATTTKDLLDTIQRSLVELVDVLSPVSFSLTASTPSFGFKHAWTAGDSIFVFFSGVAAPKYFKMGYDGTGWEGKEKFGAIDSVGCLGLKNGATGTMTAVYLPFGSDRSISLSGTSFVFSDTATPWYLTAQLPYTVESNMVSGTLDMQAPDGYVQFFVIDADAVAGTEIELREPNLTPQSIVTIAPDGTIAHNTPVVHGAPLKGYVHDAGSQKGYIFGGILAANARNVDTSYHFTLVKGGWKGDYYYRSVTTSLYRTDSSGRDLDLYQVSTWTPITDYKPIDLGCDWTISNNEKQRVYWASRNLGATSENPDDEATYGNYYAWGETSPKTEYSQATYTGTAEGDAARASLGGIWRMPKGGEWERLCGDFNWNPSGKGYVVTSNVAGYNGSDGPRLFIPAAGYYNGSELLNKGSYSRYWSSNLSFDETGARVLYSNDTSTRPGAEHNMSFYFGLSVRPVTH